MRRPREARPENDDSRRGIGGVGMELETPLMVIRSYVDGSHPSIYVDTRFTLVIASWHVLSPLGIGAPYPDGIHHGIRLIIGNATRLPDDDDFRDNGQDATRHRTFTFLMLREMFSIN